MTCRPPSPRRSTKQALAALAADPATESLVVVSKPPAPEVLADLQAYAAGLGKPVHWATLGAGRPDLTAAVESVLSAVGPRGPRPWPSWSPASDAASSGVDPCRGSLCRRAARCAGSSAAARSPTRPCSSRARSLGDIRSNIPLRPELALGADLRDAGHVVIDFGDDSMTQGRAHPMIDPSLRLERIAAEAADPTCGVLLLDLVLGHGAHPDPAPELAEAVRAARDDRRRPGARLPVVVSLTGTEGDPQGLEPSAAPALAAPAPSSSSPTPRRRARPCASSATT